jgi:hemerythrin
MTARAWQDGIDTGVESMDTEHRLLVGLVNALDDLFRRGGEAPLIARTVEQLVSFTNVHFLSEELMMRIYLYPGHDAHKAEHDRLAEQVAATRLGLEASGKEAALATIEGLHRWLVDHVQHMDRDFARWCAKNGIHAR